MNDQKDIDAAIKELLRPLSPKEKQQFKVYVAKSRLARSKEKQRTKNPRRMQIIGANARVVRAKKRRVPKTSLREWERERSRMDDDGGGYLAIRSRSKNPVKHGYDIVAHGTLLATAVTLSHAKTAGQALSDQLDTTVSVIKSDGSRLIGSVPPPALRRKR